MPVDTDPTTISPEQHASAEMDSQKLTSFMSDLAAGRLNPNVSLPRFIDGAFRMFSHIPAPAIEGDEAHFDAEKFVSGLTDQQKMVLIGEMNTASYTPASVTEATSTNPADNVEYLQDHQETATPDSDQAA